MSDVTLLEKAPVVAAPLVAAPKLPLAAKVEEVAAAASGEEMARFTVDEGGVKIIFPAEMTTDNVSDLEAFFALFITKAKRRAATG